MNAVGSDGDDSASNIGGASLALLSSLSSLSSRFPSLPWIFHPSSSADVKSPPYSRLLALSSLAMLVIVALCASAGSGRPRSQLGRRPPGRGIWSYMCGWLQMSVGGGIGVGVWGYDSSLGALSPPLRVASHCSAVLLLSALNLLLVSEEAVTTALKSDAIDMVGVVVIVIIVTALLYSLASWMIWTFGSGVSDPGGARSAKIRRSPQWDDVTTDVAATATAAAANVTEDGGGVAGRRAVTWRCVVAGKSHEATLERFGLDKGTGATVEGSKDGRKMDAAGDGDANDRLSKHDDPKLGLTGEPFGRQMWTWSIPCDSSLPGEGSEGGGGGVVDNDDETVVRLMASGGREYPGFNPSRNPNSCDRIFRAQMIRSYLDRGGSLPDSTARPKTVREAARKAVHFYSVLQTDDGHWAGDYGGPHFLMPGLVVAWYVMGKPRLMLDEEQITLMKHYLSVHQQSDGGWGTHIESPSTMFGTVLCYVALRLMGMRPDVAPMRRGREFMLSHGGAVMTSSWAKFWLCLLGVMEWEGHNSVPPEMWLLPNWVPFHPGRLWCHCRMVYLPMGYLYGSRFVYDKAETDPVVRQLREELYTDPYDSIPWSETRHLVADMDNYSPIPWTMAFLQNCLARYESWSVFRPFRDAVRKAGLEFCREYMAAEDLQTNFIDIGPVNKAFNLLSAYHACGGDLTNPAVQNHMMRVPDYLWVAEDGMKMQGYNGSQCWDTSFAIQAVAECGLLDEFPELTRRVWSYLERTQILSTDVSESSPASAYESADNRDRYYRHVSRGGWPFSTSAHGWPISDCTGEGLKGALTLLGKSKTIRAGLDDGSLLPIDVGRLCDAVNVILTLQNEDGGWATYENNRGFGWYEALNPSEVFGDIMIDYSYVECSMASLTALADFREAYPAHRRDEIDASIRIGREFMKSIQRDDGSWYGSWACCFCYGCWFGIEGLIRAGEPAWSDAVRRCCAFLLSHQRPNGGWGEDFTSCYDKDYAAGGMKAYGDDGSGVVNTGWALLALAAAKCEDVDAIKRGVRYLLKRQLPCGDWPQEGIAGVFNRACGITYTAYRNVFPIWALGRCSEVYGSALDKE